MKENFITEIATTWGENISEYFSLLQQHPIRLVSLILDLTIVIYIIVKILKLAKKSRAIQLIKGIVFFILITWISGLLNLNIVHSVLTAFLPSGVIALVVIFQPELRRALEQLGTNKLTRYFGIDKDLETKTKEDVYKVVIATTELAKTKTGGLIVIERDIKINDIIDSGVKIDSEVSPQLIVNLFTPNTPLHDGAVIVSNNKIAAAACILPLADDKDIAKEIGTRHRSGIGISKESDAIAIIVSEETGKISVAIDGKLIADVKEEALRNILIKHVINKRFTRESQKIRRLKIKKENKQNQDEKH